MSVEDLTAHDLRRVSVAAIVDPRTVARRIRALASGGDAALRRRSSDARIDAALRELGLTVEAAESAT